MEPNQPMPPPVATPTVPAAASTPVSGLAIASLVCGIASLVMCLGIFTALPGVICGHLALQKIKQAGTALRGAGLALAGLITGYLGIGMTVVGVIMVLMDENLSGPATKSRTAGSTAPQSATARHSPGGGRLERQSGRAFAWDCPQGWTAQETSTGVVLDAPDGVTAVQADFLQGMDFLSPEQHLNQWVAMLGVPDARVISAESLPPTQHPILPGVMFNRTRRVYETTLNGRRVRTQFICGTGSGSGGVDYSAFVYAFKGSAEDFDRNQQWLPAVAESLQIIDGQAARSGYITIGPINRPMDNTVVDDWNARHAADGRLSDNQQDATMGNQRVQDANGRQYIVPLNAYDPSVQGWRNPNNPGEILTPVP